MFNNTKDYGDLFDVPDFDYSNNGGYGSTEEEVPSAQADQRTTYESYQQLRQSAHQASSNDTYADATNFDDYGNNDKRNKKNKKDKKKLSGSSKTSDRFNKITRILAIVFLIVMIAFEIVLVVLDVLPAGTLIALLVIMSLLSAIIFIQLYLKNIKSWAKKLATVLSIFLIVVCGAASVYAISTLAFLSDISVKNEKSVAITKEPFNVLITGIDTNGPIREEDGRSDVNMLVTVNPTTGQVLLTSVPRDYAVTIMDTGGTDKLTHTGFYGVDVTISSLEDLFDTTINYYVRVNFTTVVKFVDAIGGIDVVSEEEFDPGEDARNTESIHVDPFHVSKGVNHLNGGQALAFARERSQFDSGDNQRVRNQQIAVTAMLEKALSSRTMLLSYNKVLNSLKDYIEMTFSSKEIRQLVKFQLLKNPSWNIMKNQLVGHDSQLNGLYIMAQDADSVDFATQLIKDVQNGEDGPTLQAKIDKNSIY